jgi:class 3 adenylate cyclase
MRMMGQGRPLVINRNIGFIPMDAAWQSPQYREGVERLAQRRMVVQYDHRGQGLSQREIGDLSLEARANDLKAVIDRVGASQVDLMGMWTGATVAISYVTANPEKVRRLVLRDVVVRGSDRLQTPAQRVLRRLIESEWPAYVRHSVLDGMGWEGGSQIAEIAIDGMTPEMFIVAGRAVREYDVTDLLPRVRCPTLLMHLRTGTGGPLERIKELAATIPNARLIQYESQYSMMLAGGADVRIIEEFLDEGDAVPEPESLPEGTAIILFADIVDSTALTERMGDAAFRAKARDLDGALRAAIRERGGTPVEGKLLGDGVLAVFTSARQTIEAALACGGAGASAGLPLHLGIHAGDVISERDPDGRDNVYGGAVNIASRIAGLSAAGEVLVSETVRSLARTSAGVAFEDRGEQELKGVGEPVRVWAVVEGP